jgi:hypothetical protein
VPFQTPTQWAILALVLVLGWVLGLLSRSGGGRYRRELAEERAARKAEQDVHARELRERDSLHSAALRDRPVNRV